MVEIVTNAFKYGNPTPPAPVVVDVALIRQQLTISVSDPGPGLPANFDPEGNRGLSMQMIGLLVRQLHGTLSIDRD